MSVYSQIDDSNAQVRLYSDLEGMALMSATGYEELGRLFHFDLELVVNRDDLAPADLVGKSITLEVRTYTDGQRYFNGIVTRMGFLGGEYNDDGEPLHFKYFATLDPWLWQLTQTNDCRIFQNQTAKDIVEAVFRDSGMTDYEFRTQGTFPQREYCVQYRESDFNFVSRLLEEEGIYYFFVHENGSHKMILDDDTAQAKPCPNYENVQYRPEEALRVSDDDALTHWTTVSSLEPSGYATTDYDFKKPNAALKTASFRELEYSYTVPEPEVFDYPGGYLEVPDGQTYSDKRLQEMQTQSLKTLASGPHRGIYPGHVFKLTDHPTERFNENKHLVCRIHYNIQNANYGLVGSAGDTGRRFRCEAELLELDAEDSVQFRPRRTTPRPVISGVHSAVVVGPASEEIYCDEYGRVKVQFHWDRYGAFDENSSCWIRVSQLWAGKEWGGIHIPRITQEVLVSFLEGDPDRPVITGRVYNDENKPPYSLEANKTQSGIKSRSSKGGGPDNFNEIRMEDKKGSEELYIHAEKNHTNITENDRSEDVGHDRSLHVGHDKSEKIDNNKTITVDGTHTETIKKATNIYITEGIFNHDVQKGTSTHHVKGLVTENFDDNQQTTVGKSISITAVNGSVTITAKTEIQLICGTSLLSMKADGTIKLSGKDISVTGSDKVAMGVGSSNVTCDKQKVATSGAAINASAVGMHELSGAVVKIN